MRNTAVFIALSLDETNDELHRHLLTMKRAREVGCASVVCFVGGYDRDPRELYEVPEVRAFCRRLVGQGFISYLDFSTTIPPHHENHPGAWGAAEVWLCAEGRMKRETVITLDTIEEIKAALLESNDRADTIVGPYQPREGP